MTAPLDAYLSHLRAAGLAAGTVALRRGYLARLAEHLGGDLLAATPDTLAGWVGQPGWCPGTRKGARSAVRGFYTWAVEAGLLDVDPSRRLPAVRVPVAVPHPAPEDVLGRALAVAEPDQRLMLLLGAYGGLRRAEIAGLHSSDVTPFGLTVRGKGGRERIVPLHPLLREALADLPPGWVFPSPRLPGRHVTPHHVYDRVRPLLGEHTVHALRHRFATRAYSGSGGDLLAVQQLLGHSRPETTSRYCLIAADSLAAAVAAVG